MTEYNLLISIQRPADYLILIKNVILKQFLPAVSNWIREKEREREREREREKQDGMSPLLSTCDACLFKITSLI